MNKNVCIYCAVNKLEPIVGDGEFRFERVLRSQLVDDVDFYSDDDVSGRLSRRHGERDGSDGNGVPVVAMKPLSVHIGAPSSEKEEPVRKKGCASEPCLNGGDCYTDVIVARGYSCRCPSGFFGPVCSFGE